DFEGYTLMQLQDSHPELFLRALDFTDFELRFPNGESRREFHERVKRVFDEVLERYAGKRLIIVTHGGVITSAVAQFTGGNPNDWANLLVRNCSITSIEFDDHSLAKLTCCDETLHLESGGL